MVMFALLYHSRNDDNDKDPQAAEVMFVLLDHSRNDDNDKGPQVA